MTERTPNFKLPIPDTDSRAWQQEFREGQFAIDALLRRFTVINDFQGVWLNSTQYTEGQVVLDETLAVLYRCLVNHTSAPSPTTFAEDRVDNPTFWEGVTDTVAFKGEWTVSTDYTAGDFVVVGGDPPSARFAVATSSHTSDALSFDTDLALGRWTVLVAGTDVSDPTLVALQGMSANGFVVRAASGVIENRTLQGTTNEIEITNPAGIAGDPTISVGNNLSALAALTSQGIIVKTASGTFANRSLVAGTGITIDNPTGVSGDITVNAAATASGASQAQQETGTASGVYVTPAVQHHHRSAAKAWGRVDNTGVPTLASGISSYNVASVSGAGSGTVVVTLDTDMSDITYAVMLSAHQSNTFVTCCGMSVSGFNVQIRNLSGAAISQPFSFVVYGDQ